MICTSFQEMDESLATWRSGLQTGQGMKDSAVCHAVVAFPDVMAGDNDENSIFESKRAKCEIGSGKLFFHCRVKRAQSRSWTCVAKNYIPTRP